MTDTEEKMPAAAPKGKQPLFMLPNGNAIAPETITRVSLREARPESGECGVTWPAVLPGVVIGYGYSAQGVTCASLAEALRLRDALIAAANEAREGR